MRKQLNNPWVVGPLACIAIGLVALQGIGLPSRHSSPGGAPIAAGEAGENGEPTKETAAPGLTAAEMFVSAGTRDPFAARQDAKTAADREAAEPSKSETLKLAAVWLQGEESFVSINSRICRAGEYVGSAVIESVTREGAWLSLPSGRQFLRIGREVTFSSGAKRASSSLFVAAREP
jgi:hypothetical protein